jgi:hypothetical protein
MSSLPAIIMYSCPRVHHHSWFHRAAFRALSPLSLNEIDGRMPNLDNQPKLAEWKVEIRERFVF